MKFITVLAHDKDMRRQEEVILSVESIRFIQMKSNPETSGYAINYVQNDGMIIKSIFDNSKERDDEFERVKGELIFNLESFRSIPSREEIKEIFLRK